MIKIHIDVVATFGNLRLLLLNIDKFNSCNIYVVATNIKYFEIH